MPADPITPAPDGPSFEDFEQLWRTPIRGRGEWEERPGELIQLGLRLRAQALRQAEDYLIARVEEGDTLAVIVARGMKCTRAVDALRAALETSSGRTLVEVVKALAQMTDQQGLERYLISVLDQGGSLDAAMALSDFRGEHVIEALLRALDDPDELVRSHAADSLLRAAGAEGRGARNYGRLLAYLRSEHAAVREHGKALFRELRQRLASRRGLGDLDEDLVIHPRSEALQRFFDRFLGLDDPSTEGRVDRQALEKLQADERVWAELVLVQSFLGGNEQALPGLAVVAGSLAAAVLGQMRKRRRGRVREAIDEILARASAEPMER
ncbi:MAG: hypothetical protein JXR96_13480 [Deltaproteobacteria bacterium]|nr:hypothetical protein [Deltaproteobacteria bacterium]